MLLRDSEFKGTASYETKMCDQGSKRGTNDGAVIEGWAHGTRSNAHQLAQALGWR